MDKPQLATVPIKVLSEYVAPWALAKETIPVHMVWESHEEVDSIKVELPREFRLAETMNVKEFEQKDNIIVVHKTHTPGYFGLLVYSSETYENQVTKKDIRIAFGRNGHEMFSRKLVARIVRPKVTIIEAPKTLTLSDDMRRNDLASLLALRIEVTGLGTASVIVQVKARGEVVSRSDTLFYNLLSSLMKLWSSERDGVKPEKGRKAADVEIDEKDLAAIVERFQESLDKGELPLEGYDKDAVMEFKKWLAESKLKDEMLRTVYSYVERYLIDLLLSTLKRYPADNVQLNNPDTKLIILQNLKDLTIRILYKDSIGNEYPPVEVRLAVEDKRVKGTPIEVPIRIDWKASPITSLG